MADNANATAGDGTLVIAADEISGVMYQRVKLNLGADGSASDIDKGQQTKANSVPVVVASDQDAVPVSGSVGINAGSNTIGSVKLTDGTETAAIDTSGNVAVSVNNEVSLAAGSNNIGDVDVVSLPSGVLAGMTSLPSGTNVIGYVRIYRQYSNNATLVPSASRASGNSSPLSVALYNSITCFLNVTVAPGTSLDVYVKSKDPISGNYVTIGQFPQVSSTGTWMLSIEGADLGSEIRFEWTVSGSNATFSIGVVLKG